MPSVWLLDAFNFIRQSKDLVVLESKNFEKAKEVLVQRLKQFSEISQEPIWCVFDATGSVNFHRSEEQRGRVRVIHTRGGETADEYLLEVAQQKKEAAIVISSDREIVIGAKRAGSSTLSSQEFERVLNRALFSVREEEENSFSQKGTVKKGPAHRRAKKDRKVSSKLKGFGL